MNLISGPFSISFYLGINADSSVLPRRREPIYLHPAGPHPDVVRAYYSDYESTGFQTSPWGWGVEAGTQAIRLILSGLFDAYPRLRIVLGHLGETIPYAVRRLDRARTALERVPSEYFCENFFITTSGNFHYPAMLCAMMTMGPDHVLFAVDYPYVENQAGVDFLRSIPVSDAERELIAHGNAERLLRLGVNVGGESGQSRRPRT